MKPRIFISYRRDDSLGSAGRIYDRLIKEFGIEQVFIDVDTITPGEDFAEAIEQAVKGCHIVLVIIGKSWLNAPGKDGTRRLDNPLDFVRIEIRTALERKIHTIPVLVEHAAMPKHNELPEDIAPLSRRNSIEVSHTRFTADVNRLIKTLQFKMAEIEAAETLKKPNEETGSHPVSPQNSLGKLQVEIQRFWKQDIIQILWNVVASFFIAIIPAALVLEIKGSPKNKDIFDSPVALPLYLASFVAIYLFLCRKILLRKKVKHYRS